MKWKNINSDLEISDHDYKKLSDEEKVNWYCDEVKEEHENPGSIINILGGGLLGEDTDD